MAEKTSVYSGFTGAFMTHTGIGTIPLIYYGTKAQKEKYLGKIITGDLITAYCLTEPDSGSDALGAKTSAILSADGRDYVLNGTKQFITNGGSPACTPCLRRSIASTSPLSLWRGRFRW